MYQTSNNVMFPKCQYTTSKPLVIDKVNSPRSTSINDKPTEASNPIELYQTPKTPIPQSKIYNLCKSNTLTGDEIDITETHIPKIDVDDVNNSTINNIDIDELKLPEADNLIINNIPFYQHCIDNVHQPHGPSSTNGHSGIIYTVPQLPISRFKGLTSNTATSGTQYSDINLQSILDPEGCQMYLSGTTSEPRTTVVQDGAPKVISAPDGTPIGKHEIVEPTRVDGVNIVTPIKTNIRTINYKNRIRQAEGFPVKIYPSDIGNTRENIQLDQSFVPQSKNIDIMTSKISKFPRRDKEHLDYLKYILNDKSKYDMFSLIFPNNTCPVIFRIDTEHSSKPRIVPNEKIFIDCIRNKEYSQVSVAINFSYNNHSNMLWFDTQNKLINRYDPIVAGGTYGQDIMDDTIRTYLSDKLPDYSYLGNTLQTGQCVQCVVGEEYDNSSELYCQDYSLLYAINRINGMSHEDAAFSLVTRGQNILTDLDCLLNYLAYELRIAMI